MLRSLLRGCLFDMKILKIVVVLVGLSSLANAGIIEVTDICYVVAVKDVTVRQEGGLGAELDAELEILDVIKGLDTEKGTRFKVKSELFGWGSPGRGSEWNFWFEKFLEEKSMFIVYTNQSLQQPGYVEHLRGDVEKNIRETRFWLNEFEGDNVITLDDKIDVLERFVLEGKGGRRIGRKLGMLINDITSKTANRDQSWSLAKLVDGASFEPSAATSIIARSAGELRMHNKVASSQSKVDENEGRVLFENLISVFCNAVGEVIKNKDKEGLKLFDKAVLHVEKAINENARYMTDAGRISYVKLAVGLGLELKGLRDPETAEIIDKLEVIFGLLSPHIEQEEQNLMPNGPGLSYKEDQQKEDKVLYPYVLDKTNREKKEEESSRSIWFFILIPFLLVTVFAVVRRSYFRKIC